VIASPVSSKALRPKGSAVPRSLAIAHILGSILLVLSAAYLLPIAWSLIAEDGTFDGFLIAGVATLVVALLLWLPGRGRRADIPARDGCLLVVLTSLALAALACLPFALELPGLPLARAFFEAVSALTTTGATRLDNLDALPQSLNLWRHLLQWLGGLGIIVLAVAILPLLGVGGMQLFRADTPGPMKESRLAPRIMQTARYLWTVYAALTLLCILALKLAGMGWFDAVCHGFSTVSLGGFSTRDANIAAFDSPAIEAVMMVFMLLSVLNFTTHFLAFRHRSFGPYRRDTEARWVVAAIGLSTVLLVGVLALDPGQGLGGDPQRTLREVAFTTVANATTAGFHVVEHSTWPPLAGLWLLMLCAVVASSGSTGGGIKMVRSLILFRQSVRELLRMSHPRAVRPLMLGEHPIAQTVVLAVMGFMLLYGVTTVGLALVLVATGLEPLMALGGALSALNNNGAGLMPFGLSPDYLQLSDVQSAILAFAMLAGRLELMIVFVLATPTFWRR